MVETGVRFTRRRLRPGPKPPLLTTVTGNASSFSEAIGSSTAKELGLVIRGSGTGAGGSR